MVPADARVTVLSAVPRILVDASRDGGVWWFPQWEQQGGFDFTLPHQGKELADYDVAFLDEAHTVLLSVLTRTSGAHAHAHTQQQKIDPPPPFPRGSKPQD